MVSEVLLRCTVLMTVCSMCGMCIVWCLWYFLSNVVYDHGVVVSVVVTGYLVSASFDVATLCYVCGNIVVYYLCGICCC